jgi:tetratricopeptide (TPR) repeat protein
VEKITQFCPITTLFLYKPWGVKNQLNECPDVKFTSGPGDSFSSKLNNIVANNFRERNVFVSVFRKSFEDFYPEGNRLLVPNGMVMKLTFDKKGTAKNAEVNLRKASYRGLIGEKQFQNSTTKLCVSNYSSAYMELGNVFKDAGDFKKAFYYMNRAVMLANEKTKAQSLTHLGILYSASGDNNTALACYKKAVEADRKLPEPYSNMAGIYNSMKMYDEAIKSAEEAIKQKPAFSEAYNNMSIAYYNKGDKKKALELMEKAVQCGPENGLAKKNLAILKGEIK